MFGIKMIDKHKRFMEVIREYDPNLQNWKIHEVYRYGGQDYEDYTHLYKDDYEIPESKFGTNCICSHPNCLYLTSIINTKGDILDPVGSSCIQRFNRPELMDQLKVKMKQLESDLVDYFTEYHLYPKVDFENIPNLDFEYDLIQFFLQIPDQDFQYNQNNIDWDPDPVIPQKYIDIGESSIFKTKNPKFNNRTFLDMYENEKGYIAYIKTFKNISYNLIPLIQYSDTVDSVINTDK